MQPSAQQRDGCGSATQIRIKRWSSTSGPQIRTSFTQPLNRCTTFEPDTSASTSHQDTFLMTGSQAAVLLPVSISFVLISTRSHYTRKAATTNNKLFHRQSARTRRSHCAHARDSVTIDSQKIWISRRNEDHLNPLRNSKPGILFASIPRDIIK